LVKVSLKVSLFMFSSSEHFQSVSDHMWPFHHFSAL
jgi:hypothetical protein